MRFNWQLTKNQDIIVGTEFRNGLLQVDYITSQRYPNPVLRGKVNPNLNGGNHYTVVDFGTFLQYNYSNSEKRMNIGIGGRLDNKVFNQQRGSGYNNKLNPNNV